MGKQVKVCGYVSRLTDPEKPSTVPKYLRQPSSEVYQVNIHFLKKISCQAEYDAGLLEVYILQSYNRYITLLSQPIHDKIVMRRLKLQQIGSIEKDEENNVADPRADAASEKIDAREGDEEHHK